MLTFYLKFDYKNLGLHFVSWPVSMTVCFFECCGGKSESVVRTASVESLPFMTTRMDLEGIMLSEINQTEKDKYCIIVLICGT